MRAVVVETRFGAGGGIVGPGRTKLTHGTNRFKHAPSPVNARWLSSIPVPSRADRAQQRKLGAYCAEQRMAIYVPKVTKITRFHVGEAKSLVYGNRSVSFNAGFGRENWAEGLPHLRGLFF